MQETAQADIQQLVETVGDEIGVVWGTVPCKAILSPASPVFELVAANE